MYVSEKDHQEIFDKLNKMNEEIAELLMQRIKYMDSVMEKVSPFAVGDEYVNVKTGECVKVTEIYRGSSVGCADIYKDGSLLDIHCYFDNGENTSCYGYEWCNPYIKLKDYQEKNEVYINKLEDLAMWDRCKAKGMRC